MKPNQSKYLVVLLGFLGISALVLGIHIENHPIFIIGLFLVISAYIIIRKKLKGSVQDKS